MLLHEPSITGIQSPGRQTKRRRGLEDEKEASRMIQDTIALLTWHMEMWDFSNSKAKSIFRLFTHTSPSLATLSRIPTPVMWRDWNVFPAARIGNGRRVAGGVRECNLHRTAHQPLIIKYHKKKKGGQKWKGTENEGTPSDRREFRLLLFRQRLNSAAADV